MVLLCCGAAVRFGVVVLLCYGAAVREYLHGELNRSI